MIMQNELYSFHILNVPLSNSMYHIMLLIGEDQ